MCFVPVGADGTRKDERVAWGVILNWCPAHKSMVLLNCGR